MNDFLVVTFAITSELPKFSTDLNEDGCASGEGAVHNFRTAGDVSGRDLHKSTN